MDNSKKHFFTRCHVIFAVVVLLFITAHPVFSQDDDEDTYNPQYSSPFAQPKFVPNISLIMDFSYVYRDVRDEEYQQYVIPGLMDAHSRGGDNDDGLFGYCDSAERGFNLNYGELNLQSAVDPYFDLFANFTLEEEGFSIEELYFTTRGMPFDLKLKVGKFLSSFGRLNPQHEHFWDFNDLPIVYNAFFGDALDEKGLQITWLAPFDFYLMLGGEILQGENETSFGNEGFTVEASGLRINRSREPNLYTGFIKTSFDTDNFIVLAGVSSAVGKTRKDYGVNEGTGFAIDACTAIYGADLTVKYLIDSYRYISLQGEYLYRDMQGSQYEFDGTRSDLEMEQSGLYAQLVVKPFLQWRFGVRYDLLHRNEVSRDDVQDVDLAENTDRYAAMIEYNFTEFSRFRLQYNHDRTKYYADERKTVHEIVFACNLAIGAHGAHKF